MSDRLGCSVRIALALALGAGVASAQAPSLELHDLDFYVHIDTLNNLDNVNNGLLTLSEYESAIDDALIDARLILQGEQGPVDSPCCTELTRPINVKAFGSPMDGLDMIDFGADLAVLQAVAGGAEAVFLVDALTSCGGIPAFGAIGCAETPGSIQVVTLGALEQELLGATIAHERGHNAGLGHVTPNDCDMMQAVAGGSCMSVADCTVYRGISTRASGICPCFADASSKLADGEICTDFPLVGICSGGVCGDSSGEAAAVLVGALDPDPSGAGIFFEQLATGSGLTGDWQIDVTLGSGARVNGLAYAADRDVLYGIQAAGLNGELLEIDPASGSVLRTTTLSGLPGLISLAYDPGGPGNADDRLLAVDRQLEIMGTQLEELIEIDPDDGTVTMLCPLVPNSQDTDFGFFSGLAYDAANNVLLGTGESGLYEIDAVTCDFITTEISHPGTSTTVNLVRLPGALGYSAASELVFMVGNQSGPQTLFTLIDAGASPDPVVMTTFGVDIMTMGGLAVMPIPEPEARVLGLSALLALAGLLRARRHSTEMRPTPRS